MIGVKRKGNESIGCQAEYLTSSLGHHHDVDFSKSLFYAVLSEKEGVQMTADKGIQFVNNW